MNAQVSLYRNDAGFWFIRIAVSHFTEAELIPITTRAFGRLRKQGWPIHDSSR